MTDHSRICGLRPGILVLAASVILLLCMTFSGFASEDMERDLKQFSEQTVRQEKARRAMEKGKAYLEDKSFDLARESFTLALRFNESLDEARFCLGLTEYGDKKFKLAVAQLENLYGRNPKYPGLALELARGYLALGECKAAGKWLERHLAKAKKNKETDKLKREIKNCQKDQEKRK